MNMLYFSLIDLPANVFWTRSCYLILKPVKVFCWILFIWSPPPLRSAETSDTEGLKCKIDNPGPSIRTLKMSIRVVYKRGTVEVKVLHLSIQ